MSSSAVSWGEGGGVLKEPLGQSSIDRGLEPLTSTPAPSINALCSRSTQRGHLIIYGKYGRRALHLRSKTAAEGTRRPPATQKGNCTERVSD